MRGEVCIFDIPSAATANGLTPPAVGIKVGNGDDVLQDLPWIQAGAGDVYAWAKAATKPTYTASEISGLSDYISGQIEDSNTKYQIVERNDTFVLQSQELGSTTWTDVSTIDLSAIVTRLTDAETAIAALGTAAEKDYSTAIVDTTADDAHVPTTAAVKTYVEGKVTGLTGAMHYIGVATTEIVNNATIDPLVDGYIWDNRLPGDVIVYGNKEFVWNGSNWRELGDEGSYAYKTISVAGTNGLTGGGDLTQDRTIEHAVATGASAGIKGSSTANDRTYIKTVTTDAYGHVTGVTTETETMTGYTYTFAEGTVDGAFQVTGSDTNIAQNVPIHGLAAIATSGSAYDVNEVNSTGSEGTKFFILDCGSATVLV